MSIPTEVIPLEAYEDFPQSSVDAAIAIEHPLIEERRRVVRFHLGEYYVRIDHRPENDRRPFFLEEEHVPDGKPAMKRPLEDIDAAVVLCQQLKCQKR